MKKSTKVYFARLLQNYADGEPLTDAEALACSFYIDSIEQGYDDYTISKIYRRLPINFEKVLASADVSSIMITINSSFLMIALTDLCGRGFHIDAATYIEVEDDDRIQAIRMSRK